MNAFRNEFAGQFFGVSGRFHNVHLWPVDAKIPERAHGKFSTQTFVSERRYYTERGVRYAIWFTARYDDNCKNGHNDFAVTGEIWQATRDGRTIGRDCVAFGCLHDDIAKRFPEIAHILKWHLCGETGPMHYAANTVYLAGDRDHNGLRKGEKRQIINGKTKLPVWRLVAVDAGGAEIGLYDLEKQVVAAAKPNCPYKLEYRPLWWEGEGKVRELEAARRVAIWPDATDAELIVEANDLRAALADRLPALLADFRAMIDASGFIWDDGSSAI